MLVVKRSCSGSSCCFRRAIMRLGSRVDPLCTAAMALFPECQPGTVGTSCQRCATRYDLVTPTSRLRANNFHQTCKR